MVMTKPRRGKFKFWEIHKEIHVFKFTNVCMVQWGRSVNDTALLHSSHLLHYYTVANDG